MTFPMAPILAFCLFLTQYAYSAPQKGQKFRVQIKATVESGKKVCTILQPVIGYPDPNTTMDHRIRQFFCFKQKCLFVGAYQNLISLDRAVAEKKCGGAKMIQDLDINQELLHEEPSALQQKLLYHDGVEFIETFVDEFVEQSSVKFNDNNWMLATTEMKMAKLCMAKRGYAVEQIYKCTPGICQAPKLLRPPEFTEKDMFFLSSNGILYILNSKTPMSIKAKEAMEECYSGAKELEEAV